MASKQQVNGGRAGRPRPAAPTDCRRDGAGWRRRSPTLALFTLVATLAALLGAGAGASGSPRRAAALALRPPMGWLNWERFMCQTDCRNYPDSCVGEKLYIDMAERLVADGFALLGYKYVNIDDCWSMRRRANGSELLVPDMERFPRGIDGLADEIHKRGLKLGIYGDCGLKTCAGYPGQIKSAENMDVNNYFDLDASTLARWRVDSFKFDGCYIDPIEAEQVCSKFGPILRSKPRDILLVCEWPFYMMYAHAKPNFTLAAESCNVWRYYDDIEGKFLLPRPSCARRAPPRRRRLFISEPPERQQDSCRP